MTSTDIQFSQRDLPWLKYGTLLDHPATSAEAVELSGLNFDVATKPAGYQNADGTWTPVPSRKTVIREDNGKFFSFVGKGYRPFQFSEAFDFMDKIEPNYVAGGLLRDGRQGFLVIQPNVQIAPAGDQIDLYIVLRTSHDRSRGIEVAIMPLRGMCMNQLTLRGFTKAAKQRWSISHTANLDKKLHQAHQTMAQLDDYTDWFDQLARKLMLQRPPENAARFALKRVIKHGGTRQEEEIEKILDLWRNDTEHVGYNDTAWGLVNAVSERVEWERPRQRSATDRLLSGLEG